MAKFKRNLITTALPYAYGPVHIGHLAGVYVPADIYVRYLRQKGEEVVFIGGSDEHGVPITIKAQKEGVTPQDIVDRYHQIIKDSFEEFGISFDIYSRTSSKTHHELSSAFFKKLYDEGKFIEKTSMQFYDEKAGQFLADRYIVGKCPHCGNERAYGDQCEACGTSLNATDLIDPVSAITGNKPELKETKHWYLPLDRYEDWLKEWILEGHKEWKSNVYGQCKSWLDNGLQPRAVTRDLDWGVPVPLDEAKGNLTLLHCLRSSVLECKHQSSILFMEDVGENLYSIDRMLQSLKLTDKFSKLQGLIVGDFTEMKGLNFGKDAYEIIQEVFADYAYPICFGFPAGHAENNFPLIIGSTIEMEISATGTTIHFQND